MMRIPRIVVAVAVVATLCACGAYRMGGSPSPIATDPPIGVAPGSDVVVTEQDRTATLQVGQKLELVLHAAATMQPWTGVRSSDTSVLAPIVNPAATAVRGVTLAAFRANAPGDATVTAYAGALCSSGQPCPMLLAAYMLHVTVTKSSSNPPVAGYDVVVTEGDHTAVLHVGQRLLVELHSKPGMSQWNGVRSSDKSVLRSNPIDVLVPTGVTVAAFQALASGQATVTAIGGPVCPSGAMCPAYAILYSLQVTVTPS